MSKRAIARNPHLLEGPLPFFDPAERDAYIERWHARKLKHAAAAAAVAAAPPSVPVAHAPERKADKKKKSVKKRMDTAAPPTLKADLTADDLQKFIYEVKNAVYAGVSVASPEDLALPQASASAALVIFDADAAAVGEAAVERKRRDVPEPRRFAEDVLVRTLLDQPVTAQLHFSTLLPLKLEVVRKIFNASGPSADRFVELDARLYECATLASELVCRLIHGWDRDLELISSADRTKMRTRVGVDAAAIDDWNPTDIAFRTVTLTNARDVPNFVDEFLNGKDDLREHPYVKDLDAALRKERDAKVKRGVSNSKHEGLPRRHPTIGPLKMHELRHHETVIARAAASDAAARAALAEIFPAHGVDAIVAQYGFEMEFRRLCDLVVELLFAFVTPDGSIFADDDETRHAIFFLALRPSFVGASIVEINERHGVAKWYLRLLERLLTFHDSTLKTKNFQVDEVAAASRAADVRRHAATRSVDSVYREIVGRLQGWVQVEIVYAIQHFYNFRAHAFEAGGHRPASKDTRARVRQLGSFFQNDPDSFDDLLRSRALTNIPAPSKRRRKDATNDDDDGASTVSRARRETSWSCYGSQKEEQALALDSTLLAVVVVGRARATAAFPERLREVGLDFPAVSEDAENEVQVAMPMCLFTVEAGDELDLEARFGTPAMKLGAAERDLSWFATRARRAKATALAAHRNALQLLEKRIYDGERAEEVTRKVARAYAEAQAEQDRVMAAVASEAASPEDEATAFVLDAHGVDGRRKMATEQSIDRVWGEIGRTSSLCTWRESLVALVGMPYNGWAWNVDDANDAQRGNSKVLALLKSLRDTLRDALELVQSDPNDRVIDFVSFLDDGAPDQSPLEVLTKTKTHVRKSVGAKRDEEPDFVGFAIGAHPSTISDGNDIVSFVGAHVSFMRHVPVEFVRAIVAVVRPTLRLVLEWMGVSHPHGHRLTRAQKPRTNVGVAWLLRCLSLAAAHEGIAFDDAEAKDGALFHTAGQRVDMATAEEMEAFARASTGKWRCVCAVAVLTHDLLLYNRDVVFDASAVVGLDQIELLSVSLSPGDELVVIDELQRDLHATDLEAYVRKIAPGIATYPPVFDWRFSDDHFTTPEAFATLLTWLPDAAHDKHGFFKLAGVRARPDKLSGVLNVADFLYDVTEESPQYWQGVFHHPLAATHRRLPTPPG